MALKGMDFERTALQLALSEVLAPETLDQDLAYFATNNIIFDDCYPLMKSKIEAGLEQFFRGGANFIIVQYERKLFELMSSQCGIA